MQEGEPSTDRPCFGDCVRLPWQQTIWYITTSLCLGLVSDEDVTHQGIQKALVSLLLVIVHPVMLNSLFSNIPQMTSLFGYVQKDFQSHGLVDHPMYRIPMSLHDLHVHVQVGSAEAYPIIP